MLDNLVEQRTVVTLYRAPPHLTVAADFNGSALLLRFIKRQHQYIVTVTVSQPMSIKITPGKGHYCIERELFCKHGSSFSQNWSLIKYVLRKGILAYMQQQEFSLLRFFYQVKEVVLLIVGARMDRDPSPS